MEIKWRMAVLPLCFISSKVQLLSMHMHGLGWLESFSFLPHSAEYAHILRSFLFFPIYPESTNINHKKMRQLPLTYVDDHGKDQDTRPRRDCILYYITCNRL